MPCAGLAAELGVDTGSLTRLLRHLVTLGLFLVHGDDVLGNQKQAGRPPQRPQRTAHPSRAEKWAAGGALPIAATVSWGAGAMAAAVPHATPGA